MYNSTRSETGVYGYFALESTMVRDSDGYPEVIGTEYALTSETYSEREGIYEFYSESTFYFTGADGVDWSFDSEAEALEWMEANGYTNDY